MISADLSGSGSVGAGTFWLSLLALAFGAGAAALWWRFGESVYVTSIMNAIIACF